MSDSRAQLAPRMWSARDGTCAAHGSAAVYGPRPSAKRRCGSVLGGVAGTATEGDVGNLRWLSASPQLDAGTSRRSTLSQLRPANPLPLLYTWNGMQRFGWVRRGTSPHPFHRLARCPICTVVVCGSTTCHAPLESMAIMSEGRERASLVYNLCCAGGEHVAVESSARRPYPPLCLPATI